MLTLTSPKESTHLSMSVHPSASVSCATRTRHHVSNCQRARNPSVQAGRARNPKPAPDTCTPHTHLRAENGGVVLHDALHVAADLGRAQAALGVAQLVQPRQRLLPGVRRQGRQRRAWLEDLACEEQPPMRTRAANANSHRRAGDPRASPLRSSARAGRTGEAARWRGGRAGAPTRLAQARPKTTMSSRLLAPRRLAPCTDAHAASPAAMSPGTTASGSPFCAHVAVRPHTRRRASHGPESTWHASQTAAVRGKGRTPHTTGGRVAQCRAPPRASPPSSPWAPPPPRGSWWGRRPCCSAPWAAPGWAPARTHALGRTTGWCAPSPQSKTPWRQRGRGRPPPPAPLRSPSPLGDATAHLGHVDAGEDGGRLADAGQPLGQQLCARARTRGDAEVAASSAPPPPTSAPSLAPPCLRLRPWHR